MSRGFDWYGGDSNGAIDFAKARTAGMRFGIRKLTQPPFGMDSGFEADWKGMRVAGITRFLYIFPDARRGAAPARDQVAGARELLGDAFLPEDGAPCFDIEFPHGLPRARAELAQFFDETNVAIRANFGCDGIPYCSDRVWTTNDTDTLGDPLSTLPQSCPLWVKTGYRLGARQALDPVTPVGMPRTPRAWLTATSPGPWIHQYQGDAIGVPGFAGTVDVNRFLHLNAKTVGPQDAGRIAWVRRKLALVGGGWDTSLESAIAAFQATHGLVADGDVGPATFARLSRV